MAKTKPGQRSADEEYKRKRTITKMLIRKLNDRLAKMDKAQSKETASWGWVGNVGHINEILVDVLGFLRNHK